MTGLTRKTQLLIGKINELLGQFGTMTVRQVYYQLVPLGFNYRQICYALNVGREQSVIDSDSVLDRSRPLYGFDTWVNPDEVLTYYEKHYKLDYWSDSANKVEIWTEKDALSAILNEEAERWRVPVRVTRGFLSTSNKIHWGNDNTVILYFGDFDPSGLSIDLDLQSGKFLEFAEFHRIALTEDQIRQFNLPSVPVKRDDPRANEYIKLYGNEGWELDALNPDILKLLVGTSIKKYVTFDLAQKIEEEQAHRMRFEELQEVD